jgi:hypothetical protein
MSIILYNITNSLSLDKIKNIMGNIYNKNINDNDDNIITLKNNFTINATIVKHALIFNSETYYYSGEIVISYNDYNNDDDDHNENNHYNRNYNHYNHYNNNYCKIKINIPNQKTTYNIYNYIYYNYNLGKNIQLTCNTEECIYILKYVFNVDSNVFERFKNDEYNYINCILMDKKQYNDEF